LNNSDDESAVIMIDPAEALKKRAEKARLYALSLFPELLETEEIESPSWGKEFTDGKEKASFPFFLRCLKILIGSSR
jgi:hypothetical protein